NHHQLTLALVAEYSRSGNDAELSRLVPLAIAAAQAALRKTPDDEAIQRTLAQLLLDDLPAANWSLLEPTSMNADSDCSLTRLPDGSILAGASPGKLDQYAIVGRSPLRRVTALRLDTVPRSDLPRGGCGWDNGGNFALTQWRVAVRRADGTTVPVSLASAA